MRVLNVDIEDSGCRTLLKSVVALSLLTVDLWSSSHDTFVYLDQSYCIELQ